jgi:hypothetical protein
VRRRIWKEHAILPVIFAGRLDLDHPLGVPQTRSFRSGSGASLAFDGFANDAQRSAAAGGGEAPEVAAPGFSVTWSRVAPGAIL